MVARTNASGEARRPITNARLKLSVARVDKVAPRMRREKDCRAWSCCAEASKRLVKPDATVKGRVSVLKVSKWRA